MASTRIGPCVIWLNGRRLVIKALEVTWDPNVAEAARCPCGKRARGTFAELRSAGWQWSAYAKRMVCGACFAGLIQT